LIAPPTRGFTIDEADTPYLIRDSLDMRCAECLDHAGDRGAELLYQADECAAWIM